MSISARARAAAFCHRFGLRVPILMAPMAGACPVSLASAVANAGGMGAFGALTADPQAIAAWTGEFRAGSNGGLQINLWIPDPPPRRDADHEHRVREFLGQWGPAVVEDAGEAPLQDFDRQCDALLAAAPRAVSSIMGLYPERVVAALKARGIDWFATVTTLAEAREAVAAGADVVIAQGAKPGAIAAPSTATRPSTNRWDCSLCSRALPISSRCRLSRPAGLAMPAGSRRR